VGEKGERVLRDSRVKYLTVTIISFHSQVLRSRNPSR